MITHIKEWIENNNLDAHWTSEIAFCLDGKDYLCIDHKEGRVFDEQFNLILSEQEQGEILVDRYCFSFGGNVYWSPVSADRPELNILKYIGRAKDLVGTPYLGIHGGYELCSGSRSYEDWVKKAQWLGTPAVGICEKNTLAGVLKFQKACQKEKIKCIIGETVTVVRPDKSTYSIKVFVQDEIGWQSLLEINRGVNIDNEGRGINEEIVLIGLPGIIVVLGEVQLDTDLCHAYVEVYDTRVYFQIDPCQFKAVDRDKKKLETYRNYIRGLYDHKIPPILICDSYYLDQEDNHIRQVLNKIGNVGFDYQSEDQYFKDLDIIVIQLDEMFTTLDTKDIIIAQALENLDKVIGGIDFEIKTGKFKLPTYTMIDEEKQFNNSEDLLWELLNRGLQKKIVDRDKPIDIYLERLEREVEVISKGGFVDYFLILHDVIRWCKQQNILTGLGRGSAAGALVSYLLDVTKIDPIEYDLLFERFLNPGRTSSLPDIDTDVPGKRRDDIKRYIESRYGAHNVCSIGTYGTLKIKASVRDLLRIKGVPPQEVNYFASMISDGDAFHNLFYDAGAAPALKKFLMENHTVLNDIPLILNQPKNASVHAAGVVITPTEGDRDIYSWMPVKKMDGILISEWEGSELEAAGFLKEDILGIKQLDKFTDIIELIKSKGVDPPGFETIDYNDDRVLELFRKGWNQDVFHFGSVGLTSYSQDVKPESIEELIAMIALYRPGVMESGAHEHFVQIKFGKRDPDYDWGCEEITKATYSVLTYQEQAMKICQVVGGFSLAEADDVRKGIGKKIPEVLALYKNKFIEGAQLKGCPYSDAVKTWNKIEAFGAYAFNRSHACAYSMTGYFCQYLKCYFPMEFWTISLQYSEEDEIPHRINEIRKIGGITITPPDINNSQTAFTSDPSTDTIYWSLGKIKFVGDNAVSTIIEERQTNGSFYSVEEFYKRVPKRVVNKRVIVNLILSGCFDGLYAIKEDRLARRRKPLSELFQLIKEDFPEEYTSDSEFFWFSKQREMSGSGHFNYDKIASISEIPFAPQRYLTPDEILMSDNIDSQAVGIGLLSAYIQKKSKKGEFGQLIIDHNNQIMEVTLWNEAWIKYKYLIESGVNRAIVVSGVVRADRYKKHNIIHSTDDTVVEIF